MIADCLKIIGDEVDNEHLKSSTDEIILATMYTQGNLSWRKVAELFKLLYSVVETDQFSLFEKAWYCLLDSVVPWIQDRGGWVSPFKNNITLLCLELSLVRPFLLIGVP